MAKAFSKNGFTGQIWPDDHNPPHIHVIKSGAEVVISLNDLSITRNNNMSPRDARTAIELVQEHIDACWQKWNEFHG